MNSYNESQDHRMLSLFLAECSDNLELFESGLLELEKDPENAEHLNNMFRAIHTIKGSSASMAFNNLESLTHQAENILDLLKKKGQGSVKESFISTFLELSDSIRSIFESIKDSGHDNYGLNKSLFANLEKIKEKIQSGSSAEKGIVKKAKKKLSSQQIAALKSLGDAGAKILERNQPSEEEANVADLFKEQGKILAPEETIRIDSKIINKLGSLIGELILNRNQIVEVSKELESGDLNSSLYTLTKVSEEIRDIIMETRLQPISSLEAKLQRIIRAASKQLNKEVNFIIEGGQTKVDRMILQAFADPLIHIIRNSVDHGIENPEERLKAGKAEAGMIKIQAEHNGNWIRIRISDDGRGISLDRLKKKVVEKSLYSSEELERMSEQEVLNIIFHPGFSTKDEVSTISGRGIGMDVVRSNIRKIDGSVEISSVYGEGTELIINLPLTLAINTAVVFASEGQRYAVAQNAIQEMISLDFDDLKRANEEPAEGNRKHIYAEHRGYKLPLIFASEFLSTDKDKPEEDLGLFMKHGNATCIVIDVDDYKYGLVVDEVCDMTDIVIRPINYEKYNFTYYSGSTIMPNGDVALILDSRSIARLFKFEKSSENIIAETLADSVVLGSSDKQMSILFKLNDNKNYLIPLRPEVRVLEVQKETIFHSVLGSFASLNDSLLRIIDLNDLLGIKANPLGLHNYENEFTTILFYQSGTEAFGLAVGYNHDLCYQNYDLEEEASGFIGGSTKINDENYTVIDSKVYNHCLDLDELILDANQDEIEEPESDINSLKVLSFSLGGISFAIKLSVIQEIISQPQFTEVPGSEGGIDGLINLRGQILMAKNLLEVLGLESYGDREELDIQESLILSVANKTFALKVENVSEIITIDKDLAVSDLSSIAGSLPAYVAGGYKYNKQIILLLDEDALSNACDYKPSTIL